MELIGLAGLEGPSSTAAAWAWLKDHARSFLELGPELRSLEHRAAVAAADLQAAGQTEQHLLAVETVRRIGRLARRHEEIADQLQPIARRLWGLGAWPWVQVGLTAAAALSLATGVAWVIARAGAETRIVRLLEQEALTAEEAERLLANTEGGTPWNPLGNVTQLVTLGVIGYALWAITRD